MDESKRVSDERLMRWLLSSHVGPGTDLTDAEIFSIINELQQRRAEREVVMVLDQNNGVKVGGRFDGWLMRRHPDGQWVSVRKLAEEDPFANTPDYLKALAQPKVK